MKWFKHDSDMHNDLKIITLISKHGIEAYAVWCLCLELVAKEGVQGRIKVDLRWQQGIVKVCSKVDSRWDEGRLQNILESMGELGLICSKSLKYGNLYIPKFGKHSRNYKHEGASERANEGVGEEEGEEEYIHRGVCKKLIFVFSDLYKQKFNTPYVVTWGKDNMIMKSLVKVLPEEDITDLMGKFFASNDDFIRKAGYTIGVFKSQIHKLRTQPQKKEMPVL